MRDTWVRRAYRDSGLALLVGFGVLGVAFAFLLPPFQVPDERAHWLTAHHKLARLVTGSGRVCSTDVALASHFQLGLHGRPTKKVPPRVFSNARRLEPECEERLLYPVGNLLSYPGVLITRAFVSREPTSGRQSLQAFYLARLLQGLLVGGMLVRLWWLAGASAIGPPGLLTLLLVSFSPLFAQQSFGVTIDAVTNAFALSLCTWLVFPDRVNGYDLAGLLVLGASTAFGKPVLAFVLPPVVALGLYLARLRREPAAARPLLRALWAEVRERRAFVLAILVMSVAGVIYAQAHSLSTGRSARQLAFMGEQPLEAARVVLSETWRIFSHPSLFIDYLGSLETRVGAASVRSFGGLALGVGLLEALACGALLFRLRRNAAGRASLRAAAPGVAVLAGLALATLGVSVLLVTVHAYLSFTTVGNTRVGSLQPRYFFPQVLLAIAVAAAVARGALCPDLPGGSVERGSERLPLIGRAAFLGLVGVLLSSFVARVSVALLTRYS